MHFKANFNAQYILLFNASKLFSKMHATCSEGTVQLLSFVGSALIMQFDGKSLYNFESIVPTIEPLFQRIKSLTQCLL